MVPKVRSAYPKGFATCFQRIHRYISVMANSKFDVLLNNLVTSLIGHIFIPYNRIYFVPMLQKPPVDQGLFVIEASRSRSDTPHSVGLPWTSDQSDAEASPRMTVKISN